MLNLYESLLSFRITDGINEKCSNLLVTIVSQEQLPGAVFKTIVLELLDDSDPFFYYSLKLTEDDFAALKVSQGLLVDFSSFPKQIVQLLERCKSEEKQTNPRFGLLLKRDAHSAQVDIVESNGFRRLVHLSLKFCAPTDQSLKAHLASALKNLKEEKCRLANRLEETSSSLQRLVQDLEQRLSEKNLENERLRIERDEKISSMSERTQDEIERERRRANEIEENLKENHGRAFDELRNQYERNLDQLESRLLAIEGENRALNDQAQRFETTVRDLQAQLKASNEECKSLNYELMMTRQKASKLDSDLQVLERSSAQANQKLGILEKEVREKDVLVMKLQDHLTANQDSKRRISEEMERLETIVIRREEAVKMITEDLVKANEIIAKLQGENKMLSGKLQVRGDLILQQERVVETRESEVKGLRDEVRKTLEEKLKVEDDLRKTKEEADAMNMKLADQEKTLMTNETVISWLNQQLKELQVHSGGIQPLSSRQVAASLANISRPPHLGQLRSTRSEDLGLRDSVDECRENEQPIDPVYFQPSPLRNEDHPKTPPSKSATPPYRETTGRSSRGGAPGTNRAPFLKSNSVGGTSSGGKKPSAKPSAYFAR